MNKKKNKFKEELKIEPVYSEIEYSEYKKDRFAKEIRKPIWKNYKGETR